MRRYELTDEQWAKLEPLLPKEGGHWGRPREDNRRIVNGMIWILRSGAPWRDLPERYGPWKSIYTRFYRWSRNGLLEKILAVLSQQAESEIFMLDSTIVRAHQHAAGAKGGKTSNL
jgi:transposase